MSELFLTVRDGLCGYGSKRVVADVNFTVKSGEFWVVDGDNGAGKSTLIKTMLGVIKPLAGSFSWSIKPNEIAYIPQDISLHTSAPATALDVVLTAFLLYKKGAKKCALQALRDVGLYDVRHQRFGKLSGGQRRRVLFARALASNPLCFILDEPTVHMDSSTENILGQMLHTLVVQKQKSVIATSHSTEWVSSALRCSIEEGRLYV